MKQFHSEILHECREIGIAMCSVSLIGIAVLDLAEEVWETFPDCLQQRNMSFMEISSKSGSQKASEI